MSRYNIPILRLTAAKFAASNPTPLNNQLCLATDTSALKIGNGYSKYNDLPIVSIDAINAAAAYKAVYQLQGTPATANAAASLTAANLLTKLITTTQATGATIALTLPTGALLDDAFTAAGAGTGESIDWSLLNLSAAAADTATITASSGHTIVGNPVVTSSHSTTIATAAARFRTRKTAADTFVTYRLG